MNLPMTVTIRRQVPVFPAVSVEEQFTKVSPIRNVSSDVWEQITVGSESTLSVAVELITTVEDELSPISVADVTFGQVKMGASSSEN